MEGKSLASKPDATNRDYLWCIGDVQTRKLHGLGVLSTPRQLSVKQSDAEFLSILHYSPAATGSGFTFAYPKVNILSSAIFI